MRDYLYLHSRSLRQCRDLDGGPGREIRREVHRIDLVHTGEVGEVGQKDCAFDHVPKRKSLVIEAGLDVFQNAIRLRLDVASNKISRGGIEWNLAGAEQHIADAHSMVVRADGRGGFLGFNDCFSEHIWAELNRSGAWGSSRSANRSESGHAFTRADSRTCSSRRKEALISFPNEKGASLRRLLRLCAALMQPRSV